MCGITAVIEGNGKVSDQVSLEAMLNVASRRGPESQDSMATERGTLLGHTMLAFVEEGNNNQPYQSQNENGNSTLVWNGEIYGLLGDKGRVNTSIHGWRDVAKHYGIQANTDTELLLKGLEQHGQSFLENLDFQGAIVAELQREGEVETIVARDKWGISPLVFGYDESGLLKLASTTEALEAGGVKEVRTVPAGTYATVTNGRDFEWNQWGKLPWVEEEDKTEIQLEDLLEETLVSVRNRIPDNKEILYTAMGGIDSESITAIVARATKGEFGGAVTVVPWTEADPTNTTLGDYHQAKIVVDHLREVEGIDIDWHVKQLTPEYIDNNLDRLLKLLGPDMFIMSCALAEDLVATTVKENGGKAIATAGGPDEAGRSYNPWTGIHKNHLERGWYNVAAQFAYSEGVRAGLVFGEHGLENRVPLAFHIERLQYAPAHQKQIVEEYGTGPAWLDQKKTSKILWRKVAEQILPEEVTKENNFKKLTVHGASGAKEAMLYVANNDEQYQLERNSFIDQVEELDYRHKVAGPPGHILKNVRLPVPELQLYCLWRWSKVEPEKFEQGCLERYGPLIKGALVYQEGVDHAMRRPLCYDWDISLEVIEDNLRNA